MRLESSFHRSLKLRTAPLVALLFIACSGSSQESSRTDTGAGTSASASTAPASTPTSAPAAVPGPNLTYGVVDPNSKDDSPIRWNPVFSGPPQTRLESGVLWAPAADVARVLSPGARVAFEGGQLKVDGKQVAARARVENGVTWAEVVPLARHFRALGRVMPEDNSVVLFPRETLLWLRDNGDPNAPAVREAREAGLLDG